MEWTSLDLQQCKLGLLNVCPSVNPVRKATTAMSCAFALFVGDTIIARDNCEKSIVVNYQPIFIRAPSSDMWIYSVNKEEILIQCPDENNSGRMSVLQKDYTRFRQYNDILRLHRAR